MSPLRTIVRGETSLEAFGANTLTSDLRTVRLQLEDLAVRLRGRRLRTSELEAQVEDLLEDERALCAEIVRRFTEAPP